jgi:aryl-alcohol dehydrogenase-like predicted oxidoreductase
LGHHPVRQGQHPREPAPTGSHHNVANSNGVTPAQISLAWMLYKNDFIVPIPGSRKLERIQENLSTADFDLTDDEFAQIEEELAKNGDP